MFTPIDFLALLVCMILVCDTSAAHARKRPSVSVPNRSNQYDKQITTFSENGELLQLHYAQEAVNRGSKAIYIRLNDMIIAVVEQKDAESLSSPSNSGMYRIHDGIMVKMTGLNGDSRLLAKTLISSANQIAWRSGLSCSSVGGGGSSLKSTSAIVSTEEIAHYCAEIQHSLTLRPGARPLAVQATFFGIGEFSEEEMKQTLALYQCNLSGSFFECDFCVSGGDNRSNMACLHKLEILFDYNKKEGTTLPDLISRMGNMLIEDLLTGMTL